MEVLPFDQKQDNLTDDKREGYMDGHIHTHTHT
jgi:hypothetical protein